MSETGIPAYAEQDAVALRRVRRATPTGANEIEDALAVERPLRITVNGREAAVVMRSPGHDDELGVGLALTQGLVRSRADLLSVTVETDAECDELRLGVPVELARATAARLIVRGSCGGVMRLDEDLPVLEGDGPIVRREGLRRMASAMMECQEVFRRTGGTHAAAIFGTDGSLVALREDVGRHNAMDKAIGHCVLNGVPLRDKVMVITGRASREMAAKGARAGVPILASVSAATDAGVDTAARARLTLVGFLRGARLTVYTHPQRIDTA